MFIIERYYHIYFKYATTKLAPGKFRVSFNYRDENGTLKETTSPSLDELYTHLSNNIDYAKTVEEEKVIIGKGKESQHKY